MKLIVVYSYLPFLTYLVFTYKVYRNLWEYKNYDENF